jgi:hypothetical protein
VGTMVEWWYGIMEAWGPGVWGFERHLKGCMLAHPH